MSKTKFNPGGTSRGFRSVGQGLLASVSQIEADTRRKKEAIQTEKSQQAFKDKYTLDAMADNHRFTEFVRKEKQSFEGKVRDHQLQAFTEFATTDVNRLSMLAKYAKDESDRLADLAPKRAKALTKLFDKANEAQDEFRGVRAWNKKLKDGTLDELRDGESKANYIISENAVNSAYKIENPEEAVTLVRKGVKFSTKYERNKFIEWLEENRGLIEAEIKATFDKAKGLPGADGTQHDWLYGESNAVQVNDMWIRKLLKDSNISELSDAGQKAIALVRSWGSDIEVKKYEGRKISETKDDIRNQVLKFKAAKDVAERNTIFNALVLSIYSGWHQEGQTTINPKYGLISKADAVILAMRQIIEGDETIGPDQLASTFEGLFTAGSKFEEPPEGELRGAFIEGSGENHMKKIAHRYTEEIVQWSEPIISKRRTRDANKLKNDGYLALLPDSPIMQEITAAQADNKLTLNESYTLLDKIDKMKIDPASKILLFGQVGYHIGSYKPNASLINVLRYLHTTDGNKPDMDAAIQLLLQKNSGISVQDRLFLQNEVNLFKQLNKAGFTVTSLSDKVIKQFKKIEKEKSTFQTSTLDWTGDIGVRHATANILEKFKSDSLVINPDDPTGPLIPADASASNLLGTAMKEEDALISEGVEVKWSADNNGWVPVRKDKKYDPNNPYNYKVDSHFQGEGGGAKVYINLAPNHTVKAAIENDINQQRGLKDWRERDPEGFKSFLDNQDQTTYTSDQISTWLSIDSSPKGVARLLSSGRLINGQQKNVIHDAAIDDAQERSTFCPAMPGIDIIISKGVKNSKGVPYTRAELANIVLKQTFGDEAPQFQTGWDGATSIKNNYAPYKRSELGINYWTACAAQDCTPRSFMSEGYVKGLDKVASFINMIDKPLTPDFSSIDWQTPEVFDAGLLSRIDLDSSILSEMHLNNDALRTAIVGYPKSKLDKKRKLPN